MNTILQIPVEMIRPNPENPRKKISQEELVELAQSISAVGLLQPITVREKYESTDDLPVGEKFFEIVCGHRRFAAAKMAGFDEVPCIVRELSDDEAYEIMITENLQRRDVDPFEESAAFSALKVRGYDTDALAEKFGKSPSYIYSRMKLTSLIPEFVKKYEDKEIDLSHCLVLSRLDGGFQKKMLDEKYSGGWEDLSGKSVRELKRALCSIGVPLKDAFFDTSACAGCVRNTACASLFLDMDEAVCTDSKCYSDKFVEAVMPSFVMAREANPDFYIINNWDCRNLIRPEEKALKERLEKDGFTFDTRPALDYYFSTVKNRKSKFDLGNTEVSAFRFGYNAGFLCKTETKVSVEEKETVFVNEWSLDRLANTRDERLSEFSTEILNERIEALSDEDLASRQFDLNTVLRIAITVILCESRGVTVFGLSEDECSEETVDGLDPSLLLPALAKIAACEYRTEYGADYDLRFVRALFPDQFAGLDEAALKRFRDAARNCWRDSSKVTDEMVEEELKHRCEKNKK